MPSFAEVKAGLAMPLAEAMETQRAIRRLRPDPVDDETVKACLELAVRAPSGGNLQNWEFVVVRDPEVKHQLARLNRQAWSVFRRLYAGRARRDPDIRKGLDATQWGADHFEETPVVVVACLRGPRFWFPPLAATSYYGSIYPAVQNLLLAARGLGLGAALTTLPVWSVVLARRTLGLPRNVTPIAAVPMGWPRGSYGPTTRRPV
ncbi:MAG: nitroreductase family protein, partial [Acidimicrobiia bacterium]